MEAGYGATRPAIETDVLKRVRPIAIGEMKKWGGAGFGKVDAGCGVIHRDQLVGMGIRQRFEQDAVDHAENGAGGADTEG